MKARDLFATVRTEGGLLPTALLQRIVRDDCDLPGLHPDTYHLAVGERLHETVSRAWSRLCGAWTSFRAAAAKLPAQETGSALQSGHDLVLPRVIAKRIDVHVRIFKLRVEDHFGNGYVMKRRVRHLQQQQAA